MFAVVGMGLRIADDPGLLDALALRIQFARAETDRLKGDRFPLLKQPIDGRFDEINRVLSPGLVVALQPGTIGALRRIRCGWLGHRLRPSCTLE